MLFHAAAIAVALLACTHAQTQPRPIELLSSGAYNATFDSPVPRFRFAVTGVVVRLPDSLRVYYDSDTTDAASIEVSVTATDAKNAIAIHGGASSMAKCNARRTVTTEHLDFDVDACLPRPDSRQPQVRTVKYQMSACITGTHSAPKLQCITAELTWVRRQRSPWPLENERGVWPPSLPNAVGNIFENYQSFSGAWAAYWHQGLDIRSELLPKLASARLLVQSQSDPNDTVDFAPQVAGVVHVPVDGRVVQRVKYGASDLYWSVMVQDVDGFVWQFHHLDPRTIKVAVGDVVKAGHVLGNIIKWPASHNGHLYHHVHMNVARPHPDWCDGQGRLRSPPLPYIDGWTYYNPLEFLDHGAYVNEQRPQSNGIFYFFKAHVQAAFAAVDAGAVDPPAIISGRVDIVLNFVSQFTPTNSVPGHPYTHGVYRLEWTVESADSISSDSYTSSPVRHRTLLRMDRMGPDWPQCAPDFAVRCGETKLNEIFRESFVYDNSVYRSVFDYRQRQLYYSLTSAGPAGYPVGQREDGWDTAETTVTGQRLFPNGKYRISATAWDYFGGNSTVAVNVVINN